MRFIRIYNAYHVPGDKPHSQRKEPTMDTGIFFLGGSLTLIVAAAWWVLHR
jgi:hypothetical protein